MKIIKITKNKNTYKLILDNNTNISLYEDTLIKYNLTKPRSLSDKELKEIVSYNNKIKAYNEALKYLSIKLRTRKEIRLKLKEYNSDIIDYVIKRLETEGYLNDTLYINSYVSDQINLTLNGPKKIINNLVKLGFDRVLVSVVIDRIDPSIWNEKIEKIKQKKINSNHNYSKNILNKKINEYLYNLGYDKKVYLDNYQDEDILRKEYEKEYKKLSRKFSDQELTSKIKNNLYKKGFSLSDIENILNN